MMGLKRITGQYKCYRPVFIITFAIVVLFCCPFYRLNAQAFKFSYLTTIPLIHQNDTLSNAWTGGLNAGQYSKLLLDNDVIEDLVVFDRATDKLNIFLAVQQGESFQYVHAPEYESLFPEIRSWVLLADYNNDGKKDIFTHTTLGIKIYKNVSIADKLAWELVADPVETAGFSGLINLLVQVTDIPAIVDIDNDGDLDILTFDSVGSGVEYHQNQSMEKYGHTDSLDFKKITACWGNFRQGTECNEFYFDQDCGDANGRTGSTFRVMHTGSSLLALDLNGDGIKDILTGHVHCTNLAMLTNKGNTMKASFTALQPGFPAAQPVDFPIFPAAYYEDLDFDGVKDLLATPNLAGNDLDQVNFTQSNWFYKNTGTNNIPQFEFRQADFLQKTMLDLGENAFPALADYDGDGDLDLFIGNRGILQGNTFYATIALYENTGDDKNASFQLLTADYLNLSSLRLTNIKPSFTDINGDKVPDMVFTSIYNSGRNTDIKYILNEAARGQKFVFTASKIAVIPFKLDANDTPLLYDIDGNNTLDLLVGKSYGNLEYYANTGTNTNPNFVLQNNELGGLPLQPFDRLLTLAIADLNGDSKADLITGDRNGQLKIYASIKEQLNKTFEPVTEVIFNSLTGTYTAAKLSGYIFPATGDLDGDTILDLVVGTQAGGIMMLKNLSEGGDNLPDDPEAAILFPNPTNRYLYLRADTTTRVQIFSVLGQLISSFDNIQAGSNIPIDLKALPQGTYLVKIISGEVSTVKKIVLIY